MKVKAVQYFSDEYLESVKDLTPEEILLFLDQFRQLYGEDRVQKLQ